MLGSIIVYVLLDVLSLSVYTSTTLDGFDPIPKNIWTPSRWLTEDPANR